MDWLWTFFIYMVGFEINILLVGVFRDRPPQTTENSRLDCYHLFIFSSVVGLIILPLSVIITWVTRKICEGLNKALDALWGYF